VVRPHGFGAEAAGRDWAHWVRDDDSSVTLRAYASLTDGGVVSIIMTGAPMPAELKLDLRRAVVPP
jgi:hypothetical protein